MKMFKRAAALFAAAVMAGTMFSGVMTVSAEETAQVLAFPEAEGGGKYAKGARAAENIEVYHVTNLNDSGEGSFREGVSKSGRIVVFDIDGTIKLESSLRIAGGVTVLGQTAPGEGITITGYDIQMDNGAKDIIVRYLKVRPTDDNGGEPDGLGGRFNTNVIFDHCSLSWSVDELLTLYAGSYESASEENPHGSHLTVQYCLASESLRMSSHFKGAHGYGGIMGADLASYHHNLLAHHDSRSPRLDREMNGTEVTNNLIYNWGQTNSAYGGEPYSMHDKSRNPTNVNYTYNYYSYGPSTKSSIKSRIFDATNTKSSEVKSNFYFDGNYVYGYADVTADNTKGVNNAAAVNMLTEPFDMGEYTLSSYETAEEAYNTVLESVGATIPKRDAIDARIIDDVKHKTGRVINNATEVGGMIDLKGTTETRVFAVPESFKSENGLTAYGEADIIREGEFAGYTLTEAYVNDWTAKQAAPTNPSIVVMSPATASLNSTVEGKSVNNGNWSVVTENETVNYHAAATAVGGKAVTKMELYDGNSLIKDYGAVTEINDNLSLAEGTHYLSCRAYNEVGEATQSTEAIVYVKKAANDLGAFTFTELGSGKFKGLGGGYSDGNGGYTLYGSGTLTNASTSSTAYPLSSGKSSDTCSYMYIPVKGNFDISIKVDSIPKFENQQNNGLMMRESLLGGSRMAMITYSMLKLGENERIVYRETEGSNSLVTYFKNETNSYVVNPSSGDNYPIAPYMRIVRYGDDVYLYVSQSGEDWTDDTRQVEKLTFEGLADEVYIGYAVDSADSITVKPYFAASSFSNVNLATGADVADPSDTSGGVKFETVDHTTSNGFFYDRSFLVKDNCGGDWVISSDGNSTLCYESATTIAGNDTNKLALIDKAVQIAIPEEYRSGGYKIEYDFLTTNTASAGRSFRTYIDNAVHPYDSTTGQATAMGTDGAYFHMMDIGSIVYSTSSVTDIAAKAVNDTMDTICPVEANKWYHVTLEGTSGESGIKLSVALHGTDGTYAPDSLTPVYNGTVKTTEGRDTTPAQLKFMHTAAGNLYYDNISFSSLSQEPKPTASGDVDGNGILTANDAAVLLQNILTGAKNPKWSLDLETADLDGSGDLTAADAAYILSRVINSAYK